MSKISSLPISFSKYILAALMCIACINSYAGEVTISVTTTDDAYDYRVVSIPSGTVVNYDLSVSCNEFCNAVAANNNGWFEAYTFSGSDSKSGTIISDGSVTLDITAVSNSGTATATATITW